MAITYPIAFPTRNPLAFTLRTRNAVGVAESPTTYEEQKYRWQGERWEGSIDFGTQGRANGEVFAAWLTSLQGSYGSFLAGDWASATPRGAAASTPGTPVVTGSPAARARTFSISTGLGTVANYLRTGDYISFGSGATRRLHKVLTDVSLTGGAGSLEIWPGLRSAYANGTAVVVANCTGKFRIVGAEPEWTTAKGPNGIYTFAPFNVVEQLA